MLRQQLLEKFHVVFKSQPPMEGEQLNNVLDENPVSYCVFKARPIPIAY